MGPTGAPTGALPHAQIPARHLLRLLLSQHAQNGRRDILQRPAWPQLPA